MAVEDLYWNSIDFSSEESIPQLQKDYIDPWDLENYAYIRQHLDSLDLSSDPSSLEEPSDSNSSFYYLPKPYAPIPQQRYDSLMSDQGYAAIEEVAPWRRSIQRTSSTRNSEMSARRGRRSELVPDAEENPYGDNNRDNSMLYIYESRSRCRHVAMPPSNKLSRERSMSFSYGDYGYDRRNSYYGMEEMPTRPNRRTTGLPLYDDVKTVPKPSNFSLSNYGHLKIDYSYSWNNLDKYIYQ